jgi:radical SAM superfamily enzyme YgiQ (UPF0313 family)
MLEKKLEFSVPSIKAESVDEEFISLVAEGGQKTLTLAPECNEKLRFEINKRVKDEVFFKVIQYANKHSIKTMKYYFIIGLPNQQEEELAEMVSFIRKLKEKFNGKTYVSINPLVPKPNTEFEDVKFDKAKIKKQANFLKKELAKVGIKLKLSGISTSELEYKMARSKSLTLHPQ